MEYQLRDYLIDPDCVEQFARELLNGVRPLREAAGFMIDGAWAVSEHDQFIWMLGWPGRGTFAEADAYHYQSRSRWSLDPDPARLIVATNGAQPRNMTVTSPGMSWTSSLRDFSSVIFSGTSRESWTSGTSSCCEFNPFRLLGVRVKVVIAPSS